jgi:hypothetical protein
MLTWAPRRPSRNSRFTNSGSPARDRPMGSAGPSGRRTAPSPAPPPRPSARPGRDGAARRSRARSGWRRSWPTRRPRREHPVLDEEHVRVEARALVTGPHLGHHPEHRHDLPAGQHPFQCDDVVELQVLAVGHRHPELERRGVLGADDPTDGWARVSGEFTHRRRGYQWRPTRPGAGPTIAGREPERPSADRDRPPGGAQAGPQHRRPPRVSVPARHRPRPGDQHRPGRRAGVGALGGRFRLARGHRLAGPRATSRALLLDRPRPCSRSARS